MLAWVWVVGVVLAVIAMFAVPDRNDPRRERDEAVKKSVEGWKNLRQKMKERG